MSLLKYDVISPTDPSSCIPPHACRNAIHSRLKTSPNNEPNSYRAHPQIHRISSL
ncbi:hypothetical protein [Rubritalea tangerina]|uniref:hypothetical protein n=1 Tax=Rubritalea tangerina TaxID=430798 RepID=UPI00361F9BD8